MDSFTKESTQAIVERNVYTKSQGNRLTILLLLLDRE